MKVKDTEMPEIKEDKDCTKEQTALSDKENVYGKSTGIPAASVNTPAGSEVVSVGISRSL